MVKVKLPVDGGVPDKLPFEERVSPEVNAPADMLKV